MTKPLTDHQIERYQRQIIMPEIGPTGQQLLLASRVAVVGVGGLGSPAAVYLAGAGVGTLTLIDGDAVTLDNLHRQILYTQADQGCDKVRAAAIHLNSRNPDVVIEERPEKLTADNASSLLDGADFVIDATDNFPVRFAIADTCHDLEIPYVHAGVQRFQGQGMTVLPGRTTCYRCIFPEPPAASAVPTCAETGILGPVAGFLSMLQATEAVKFLTGTGELLTDRFLTADLLNWRVRITPKTRQPTCPLCGEGG